MLLSAPFLAAAFVPAPMGSPLQAPQMRQRVSGGRVLMADDRKFELGMKMPSRGVSVDQDGKQNIWATSVSKGEVEEQDAGKLAVITAIGAVTAFALVIGSFLLIPDPDA